MSEVKAAKPSVEYNWLGPNCGIKVSNLCLGTWTFGTPDPNSGANQILCLPGSTDEADSHAILDRYSELGGNFIDTANIYGAGQAEKIVGTWLSKHDRSSVVVATKVGFTSDLEGEGDGPNDRGLSRGSILTNIERSLHRLNTDYVDIYYAHCWDSGVKLEETLRTFNDLVRCGKVRYVGVSNVTGAQLQKIVDYNQFLGFNQCITVQQEYSLLERHSDIEVVPTCKTEGVSLTPFSPLKGGLLTGKFKREDKDTAKTLAGTRLGWTAERPAERTWSEAPYIEDYRNNEEYWKLMNAMETIGNEHGKSTVQVAVRWLLQQNFISSVIIGAKTIRQLDDNMGAGTGWKLSDDQVKLLDKLSTFSGQRPKYPYKLIEQMNLSRFRP